MKKEVSAIVATLAFAGTVATGFADPTKGGKFDGKAEFEKHCAACHPNGGNIVNAKKTLKKADLTANKIKNAADMVKLMRKPGAGMTAFDAKTISDKEARAIAEYILKTFK